jgi:hypothetical protein
MSTAERRDILVYVPDGREVTVDPGPLGDRVREEPVDPTKPPPPPPPGRPIWPDPNVLQFLTRNELRATGTDKLRQLIAQGAPTIAVVIQEPAVRYDDIREVVQIADDAGIELIFAVGLRWGESPTAGAGA